MYVKEELSFEDLKKRCWSGAIDTLQKIEEEGEEKQEQLINLLQEEFSSTPSITEVNDLLWFEDDYIFESLGIEVEED